VAGEGHPYRNDKSLFKVKRGDDDFEVIESTYLKDHGCSCISGSTTSPKAIPSTKFLR